MSTQNTDATGFGDRDESDSTFAQRGRFDAARLTLLALRADTVGGTRASRQLVGVGSADAPLSMEAAARHLAGYPKPLKCSGTIQDGMLVVHARPYPRRDLRVEQNTLHCKPVSHDFDGPLYRPFSFLDEGDGLDLASLPVIYAGAGEAMRASVGDYIEWQRDYRLVERTGRVSCFAQNLLQLDGTMTAEMLRRLGLAFVPVELLDGAVALVHFKETDEEAVTSWHLRSDQSPAYFCDDCDVRRAEVRVVFRADGEERARVLCGNCDFVKRVLPIVGDECAELALHLLEPSEETAAEEELCEFSKLLICYEAKLGLPLPCEWANFVRRHPPED